MTLRNVVPWFVVALLLITGVDAHAERIKDIASIAGVRTNQLVGYGLVVGLDGSGDSTVYTTQSLKSMLAQFGITIPPGVNPQSKNVAAVSLHTELPPFAKPGHNIDVTVSSIGNAKSLRGGTLLLSPLRGADGNVYAIAQGNVVVGGFGVAGSDGSKVTVNVPSVGRIPGGASVERVVANPFLAGEYVSLNLNNADFTTAKRMSQAINKFLGDTMAVAVDGGTVRVSAPFDPAQRVAFVSELENINVDPGESAARIIVNSRTGTIVIGKHVKVSPAAVTHGSLSVTITNRPVISQPAPFSEGQTVVAPVSEIEVSQGSGRMFLFETGVSLEEIVRAVNQVGAAPGDLIAILEALKQSGALQAELVII